MIVGIIETSRSKSTLARRQVDGWHDGRINAQDDQGVTTGGGPGTFYANRNSDRDG